MIESPCILLSRVHCFSICRGSHPQQKEEEQPDSAPRPMSLSVRSALFLCLVRPKSDGILWPLIDEMSLHSQG